MSVKFHNETYVQPINKKEFNAPREVVNSLLKEGFGITSGNGGKTIQVQRTVNGKSVYCGTLAAFVKQTANYAFRDNNSRNVTLGNLKAM